MHNVYCNRAHNGRSEVNSVSTEVVDFEPRHRMLRLALRARHCAHPTFIELW